MVCGSVLAEMRVWTLNNGKSLEAEFISLIGGQVSLKTLKGKQHKVPESSFSENDLTYIELQMPPKLNLSFSKTSTIRIFPDSHSDLPRSQYYDFKAKIKQTSTKPYKHELVVEFFVIGEEKAGDHKLLLDYQKENFHLSKDSGNIFELSSNTIELLEFNQNGQLRGDSYRGSLIMVTDVRGEVIAHKTQNEDWFQNVENLRKVPRGKTFDKNCNRCFPTRPRRFY